VNPNQADRHSYVDGILHGLFVPYALTIVLALIVAMAAISRNNAHPDEFVHMLAALYYKQHVLPPELCAPDTIHTYSPYGASRLNTDEIAYNLAGKFAILMDVLPLRDYHKLRMFNISLFVLIILMAFARPGFRLVALPLLLSPQVWYVFSYFNSEGFAVFITVLLAYQLIEPTSFVRRHLFHRFKRRRFASLMVLGVLIGLVLVLKKSFYFFLLFLGMCALIFAWSAGIKHALKEYAGKTVIVSLLALLVGGSWIFAHEAVNGFDRWERIKACKEQTAQTAYRLSTPLERTAPTVYWRKKGKTISDILDTGWASVVYRSAFGYYGYLQIPNSAIHFKILKYLLIGFVGYLALSVLIRGERTQRLVILAGLATALAVFAMALYKSWTRDFQPQGRYQFSLFAVTGFTLAACQKFYNEKIVFAFVLAIYFMSLKSFIFTGLIEITKATA